MFTGAPTPEDPPFDPHRAGFFVVLPVNEAAGQAAQLDNSGSNGVTESGSDQLLKLLGDCYCEPMKFVSPSHFTDPDAAARKLVQIANASEAVQDGRIYIELINNPFLREGGTPDQYRAALARAVALGWLWLHESGTYVKFTPAGAELFA
jgi:hypothetical protein